MWIVEVDRIKELPHFTKKATSFYKIIKQKNDGSTEHVNELSEPVNN